MEACVEVKSLSQAISKGPQTHAWPLEALQNAAPVSQISITLLEIIGDWLYKLPFFGKATAPDTLDGASSAQKPRFPRSHVAQKARFPRSPVAPESRSVVSPEPRSPLKVAQS